MNLLPLPFFAPFVLSLASLPALHDDRPVLVPEDAGASWDGESRVVHEWGTFTTVRGSQGATLGGLMHDERDLPRFVHDIQQYAAITGSNSPKMETPVIYFYSPDRWRIQVDVEFPRGLITRWYPAASEANFAIREREDQPPLQLQGINLENGFIRWGSKRDLYVLPPDADIVPEPVEKGDPWRYTRDVHANWLEVCNRNQAQEFELEITEETSHVYERFLFYRGLGSFELPVFARATRENLTRESTEVKLELINPLPETPIGHLFVVRVHQGRCAWARLDDLHGRTETGPLKLEFGPMSEATEELVGALTDELAQTGLFLDEAYSMARTWQHGYFQEEGLRILYVIPPKFVDGELPLSVRSMQKGKDVDSLVRTFVARVELLAPETEAEYESVVRDFTYERGAKRERSRLRLLSWGRFRAPYLEGVALTSQDPKVVAMAERLLEDSSEINTEIR